MKKLLDLRFVIGAFFLVVGALLVAYYFVSTPTSNINSWCGTIFIAFGITMISISYLKKLEEE